MRGLPIIQFLIALIIVGLQGWGLTALLGEPVKVEKNSAKILQSPLISCIVTISVTSPPVSLEIKHQGRSILKLDASSSYPYEQECDLSLISGLELEAIATWAEANNSAIKLDVEPLKKVTQTVQLWSNKAKLHNRILLKW